MLRFVVSGLLCGWISDAWKDPAFLRSLVVGGEPANPPLELSWDNQE